MRIPAKLFGIVGFPLGHSLSPALHNRAFEKLNYPGVYMAFEEEPDRLADFFKAVRVLPITGGNITIPHKVVAMQYMDELSGRAEIIGAINTFYRKDGRLCGENTDIDGFIAPLKGKTFRHALVLGCGGVSRAVLVGLKELAIPEITVTNRTEAKAEKLAEEFQVHAIPWSKRMEPDADLIINATSQGMKGQQVNMTPYDAAALNGRHGLVYDIVYNPLETRLLKEAKAAGWQVENGLTMFVEQARAAFRIWTGQEMPEKEATAWVKELLAL